MLKGRVPGARCYPLALAHEVCRSWLGSVTGRAVPRLYSCSTIDSPKMFHPANETTALLGGYFFFPTIMAQNCCSSKSAANKPPRVSRMKGKKTSLRRVKPAQTRYRAGSSFAGSDQRGAPTETVPTEIVVGVPWPLSSPRVAATTPAATPAPIAASSLQPIPRFPLGASGATAFV